MCGVPAEKSCRMIVSTTFVAFACALLMRSLVALEFQTVKPESAAMFPSSLTCRPKKATVVRSEKFHVEAPIVGSLRLLASAKPKISLCGPPGPPTAAMLGGAGTGFLLAALVTLAIVAAAPVAAGRSAAVSAPLGAIPDPAIGPLTAEELMHAHDTLNLSAASGLQTPQPLRAFNHAGLQKEVFGFAPYWVLSKQSTWNYKLLSTIAYFGLSINWDGTWIKSGGGYFGYRSQDLIGMVNTAHANGVRVLLTIKGSGQAPLYDILTVPAYRDLAVQNTIDAIANKNLDGVNIDFEGKTDPAYPGMQDGLTTFTAELSNAMHARWPSSMVTIATYTGSASWDGGLMRIDALAPYVDAMFVMGYDMSFSNM